MHINDVYYDMKRAGSAPGELEKAMALALIPDFFEKVKDK